MPFKRIFNALTGGTGAPQTGVGDGAAIVNDEQGGAASDAINSAEAAQKALVEAAAGLSANPEKYLGDYPFPKSLIAYFKENPKQRGALKEHLQIFYKAYQAAVSSKANASIAFSAIATFEADQLKKRVKAVQYWQAQLKTGALTDGQFFDKINALTKLDPMAAINAMEVDAKAGAAGSDSFAQHWRSSAPVFWEHLLRQDSSPILIAIAQAYPLVALGYQSGTLPQLHPEVLRAAKQALYASFDPELSDILAGMSDEIVGQLAAARDFIKEDAASALEIFPYYGQNDALRKSLEALEPSSGNSIFLRGRLEESLDDAEFCVNEVLRSLRSYYDKAATESEENAIVATATLGQYLHSKKGVDGKPSANVIVARGILEDIQEKYPRVIATYNHANPDSQIETAIESELAKVAMLYEKASVLAQRSDIRTHPKHGPAAIEALAGAKEALIALMRNSPDAAFFFLERCRLVEDKSLWANTVEFLDAFIRLEHQPQERLSVMLKEGDVPAAKSGAIPSSGASHQFAPHDKPKFASWQDAAAAASTGTTAVVARAAPGSGAVASGGRRAASRLGAAKDADFSGDQAFHLDLSSLPAPAVAKESEAPADTSVAEAAQSSPTFIPEGATCDDVLLRHNKGSVPPEEALAFFLRAYWNECSDFQREYNRMPRALEVQGTSEAVVLSDVDVKQVGRFKALDGLLAMALKYPDLVKNWSARSDEGLCIPQFVAAKANGSKDIFGGNEATFRVPEATAIVKPATEIGAVVAPGRAGANPTDALAALGEGVGVVGAQNSRS